MDSYLFPSPTIRPALEAKTAWLVTSGDQRESANLAGWPIQVRLENELARVFAALGWGIHRASGVDPATGHGFISSQRMGLEVFAKLPIDAPLIVAESIWQYSHHVLAGLRNHRGPILTVANFAGDAPGLVGLLGLNASLSKMGVQFSTTWSENFRDDWFIDGIRSWVETGLIHRDTSHVRDLDDQVPSLEKDLGEALARQLSDEKAILGVFDEGCMGMYNAIIDDEVMNTLGIYKERLSQSALWAEMCRVPESEAAAVLQWLRERGMRFRLGDDEESELTTAQLMSQARMYISILRIADDFGLDVVGIQYQQGLKDICPASDLAEGLLNDRDRPPVRSRDGNRIIRSGLALPLANEADEGAAIDALVTSRVWAAMGLDPETTLHDIRWGEQYEGRFVWVFEISGAVPPSHLIGGYAGAEGWRQNPMYFPLGGSTIRGISKPGEIVWSRVYLESEVLHVDLGRGAAIELPMEEAQRRWDATNPEWPIMHAVLHGVDRNQLMGRHRANHIQIAYAPDSDAADRALATKAALLAALGVEVHLIGQVVL